ncbi:hypothetical protein KA005_59925, partial [bacterium]|nr:hypothetical protein [bacterium]
STSHWGHAMYDITNYYIRQGLDSGFVTLVFLIIVLILATRICGKYSLLGISRAEQWLGWAFCVSVLGHCMSFFGVSYFGKLPMLLYLTYAVASMMNDKQKTAMKTQFVSNVRYHQKPFMGKYL